MSGRRKRRAIQESSEDEDDNPAERLDHNEANDAASLTQEVPAVEVVAVTAAEMVKSRLRERLQKSQAKAAASETKKKKSSVGDEASKVSSKRGEEQDGATKQQHQQETTIPKKKKEVPVASIPKKDSDNNNNITNQPSSSLLAMMKQVPPPPMTAVESLGNYRSNKKNTTTSTTTPSNHVTPYAGRPNRPPNPRGSVAATAAAPPPVSTRSTHNKNKTPRENVLPVTIIARPPGHDLSNSAGSTAVGGTTGPGQGQRTIINMTPITSHPPPQPPRLQRNMKLEQMVWDTLQQICQEKIKDLFVVGDDHEQPQSNNNNNTPTATTTTTLSLSSTNKTKRPVIDLTGSILKLKQTIHQHPIMMLTSEMGGGGGGGKEEELDFFDVDDEGCIVLQPVIPMFPEDFPADSQPKTWPLSVGRNDIQCFLVVCLFVWNPI
jgi:hypothetical protein